MTGMLSKLASVCLRAGCLNVPPAEIESGADTARRIGIRYDGRRIDGFKASLQARRGT